MNHTKLKENSAWFVIKVFFYLALILVGFLLVAMGIVPFLVRLDTMDTTSRIGHGLVALASMFFIRFLWRRYANLFKIPEIEMEEEKAKHEALLAKQKKYQKLTLNEKSREHEQDKKAKVLANEKILKTIRYRFIGLAVFYAIGAIYVVRAIPEQAFWIGVIVLGSIYLLFLGFGSWAYRHKKTILRSE